MKKISFCIAFIISSNVIFLSGCQTGQTKVKAAPEVLAEFDFSNKDGYILLPVILDGEKYQFILDTGTIFTIFHNSFKDKLGEKKLSSLEVYAPSNEERRVVVERFPVPDVYIGDIKLNVSRFVGVMDLDMLKPGTSSMCDGIIGMDFLKQYIIQIDFDNGKVIFLRGKKDFDIYSFLRPKQNEHPEWGEPIKIKARKFNIRTVRGKIIGCINTDFVIDTGCFFPGLLRNELFDKMNSNLDITKNDIAFINTIPDNNSFGPVIKTDRFSVGAFNYNEMLFNREDVSTLGLPFFSHHLVTFDFPNNIMYLKKGEEYGKQFGYLPYFKDTGITLNVNNENIFVCQVDPNSLAERKGIRQNDIVTEFQVNDQILTSFKPVDFLEFSSKLPKPEDRTYTFTFKRGDDIFIVNFIEQDVHEKKNGD